MEKDQLIEIEKYLKSKNLSSAVFAEVYDHFVMQISELINKQEIGFHEAFLQTKVNWQNELEMVKADLFSFKKIAKIEKGILQDRFRKMMMMSFVFSVIVGTLFYCNENIYLCVQGVLIIIHLLFLMYHFIFRKMSFSEYQKMSFHPLLLRNLLLMLIILAVNTMFFTTENLWNFPLNHMAVTFSVILQIQLLYFRVKKINVLLA
jgi:predicted Abi (CAAX) family protease